MSHPPRHELHRPSRSPQSPTSKEPVSSQRTTEGANGSPREHGSQTRAEDAAAPTDSDVSESEDDNRDGPLRRTQHKRLTRAGTFSKAYSDEEEKVVLRKLDRKLVLFLGFLYLLSFLDRSNIGNARIAGLESALNMTGRQFDLCLVAFYITYITFEWMILLYRVVPPHIYISLCVLSWGLIASLQSVVTSFPQLLVLRGLLGITEASFGPGVPFYMTFFYRREELAYRVGLQISAAPLATSFASSLAWCIIKLSQDTPLEPWRALFLFEGFPSVITAIFAWYLIPDSPETVRFLTPRERKVARLRLQHEHNQHFRSASSATASLKPRGISGADALKTLLSPLPWLQALMFFSVNVSFASLPVFLPTIINSMSFSPLASQILAAPPYLVAFIFVLVIGHRCDKTPDSRSYFLAGVALLSSISYALIAIAGFFHEDIGEAGSITLRYVSVFGAAMGLFAAVVLIITWNLNNQQSSTGKGTAMVVLNVVGQCGPLVGVNLFADEDGPLYIRGMAICSGFMFGVALLAIMIRFMLQRMNRKKFSDMGSKGKGYELINMPAASHHENGPEGGEEVEGLISEQHNVVSARDGFRYML